MSFFRYPVPSASNTYTSLSSWFLVALLSPATDSSVFYFIHFSLLQISQHSTCYTFSTSPGVHLQNLITTYVYIIVVWLNKMPITSWVHQPPKTTPISFVACRLPPRQLWRGSPILFRETWLALFFSCETWFRFFYLFVICDCPYLIFAWTWTWTNFGNYPWCVNNLNILKWMHFAKWYRGPSLKCHRLTSKASKSISCASIKINLFSCFYLLW